MSHDSIVQKEIDNKQLSVVHAHNTLFVAFDLNTF